ncbi:MAG: rubredoxin-like domain-containing protein [Desulfopila sp.]
MKKWKCTVCGYIHEGETPPEQCPLCKAPAEKFVEIVETAETKPKEATANVARQWRCSVCGYVVSAEAPPEECPVCKAARAKFVEIEVPPAPSVEQQGGEQAAAQPAERPGLLARVMLRLHVHPVSVHLPNGILPVAVIFLVVVIFLGIKNLEPVAFFNLVAVLISMPLVLFSGFMEWKKRYNGAKTVLFLTKILCSVVVTLSLVILVIWRMFEPGVADADSPFRLIYFGVAAVMLAATGIAGHLGGKLVFGARDSQTKR